MSAPTLSPPPPSGSTQLDGWLGLLWKNLTGGSGAVGNWAVSGSNVYRGGGQVIVGASSFANPYAAWASQNGRALGVVASGTGTSVSALILDNPVVAAGTCYHLMMFTVSNTASSEKRLAMIHANTDADSTTSPYGFLSMWTANNGSILERMRIDSNGRVGINTSSPSAYLNIVGGNSYRALQITQSVTAVVSAQMYNELNLTETNVAAGASLMNAFRVNHTVTGSSTTGGRNSFELLLTHATPSNASNALRYYVGAAFVSYSLQGDGGTGLGDLRGNYYGINPVVTLGDGGSNTATWVQNATAIEVNTNVQTGSSVWYKSGIQIAGMATDKVRGSGYDAMISCSGISGAVGWHYGLLFSAANGQAPMDSTIGILMGVLGSDSAYRGIEIASYSFSDRVIYVKNQKNDSAARGLYVETTWGADTGRVIEAYVSGNEQFRVDGDSANAVWVRVNSAMKKLEVGAADSAGAGYRTVMVRN